MLECGVGFNAGHLCAPERERAVRLRTCMLCEMALWE